MARAPKGPKRVETLTHEEARRRNIPTAELAETAELVEQLRPAEPVRFPRAAPLEPGETRPRDPDLDPQLIWNGARIRITKAQAAKLAAEGEIELGEAQLTWRGKDQKDWSDLVVPAPQIFVQEKIHPKAIISSLAKRGTGTGEAGGGSEAQVDLFADFNGLAPDLKAEFYAHDQDWSNRMILGDSLAVMASLASREKLAGKVQCIYFDPPYGIRFNSNWQVSTASRDVRDGKLADLSREPEQVRAFRDTWKDGIHSYLTYLRDRLTVARELLTESGSIFVQIGDENVHRVRAVMDEVFGAENYIALIAFTKTSGSTREYLGGSFDYIAMYGRDRERTKVRPLYKSKSVGGAGGTGYSYVEETDGTRRPLSPSELNNPEIIGGRILTRDNLTSQSVGREKGEGAASWFPVQLAGRRFLPSEKGRWKTNEPGMRRLQFSHRLIAAGNTLRYVRFLDDFAAFPIADFWSDTSVAGFAANKRYVVETSPKVIERCLLMATDPGDLVLDPTCGSGTTATVAEQWGRRWITIDTSRVALALARTRLMAARYPYFLLADSPEGRKKEQEVSGRPQPLSDTAGDIRQGFVYERAPHITLKSIANNAEIDVIWETWEAKLAPLRERISGLLSGLPPPRGEGGSARSAETGGGAAPPRSPNGRVDPPHRGEGGASVLEEWQLPREAPEGWPAEAGALLGQWWQGRIARQKEIDASIANRADVELLYDRPYRDEAKVRVAGPFTVESLSPHRIIAADADALAGEIEASEGRRRRSLAAAPPIDFAAVVLENLKIHGVQQSSKAQKLVFSSLSPWPGEYIAADARFLEGEIERRAAIFIGPEFGTLSRPDVIAAAREATEARFDVLVACAFNFEAHASELARLGPLPILKAKINPDLHMAGDLATSGKGNLFIVFGEPDIEIEARAGDEIAVRVKGIDVFDPNTGEVRSGDVASIAAWFIDDDYDEESFFVRQAYFLGANDPYAQLKTALKAEIDEAAWASLYRDVSWPFPRPASGRIAVKVINHFGDEVMKVFRV